MSNGEKFFIKEYVRWSDVDYAGLICYGAYLRFFELAEMELFRAAGLPYKDVFERFQIWLPRVQLHCDFHYPARLDEELNVAAYIGRVGNKSLTIKFEVTRAQDGKLNATGHFIMTAVDRENFQSVKLPEGLVASLARFTIDQ